MSIITLVPPTVEPVNLQDVKDFLRLDQGDTSQDSILSGLMVAAREYCETYTKRKFVTQTLRLSMDFFPGTVDIRLGNQPYSSALISGSQALLAGLTYGIVLPYSPVQSIVQLRYISAEGFGVNTLDPSLFVQDLAATPARLIPNYGTFWPIALVTLNAVTVDYVCGYGRPVSVTIALGASAVTGATFAASDVGVSICIPGAGINGGALTTMIASVISGAATLATPALTAVVGAVSLLGMPSSLSLAVKLMTAYLFENRVSEDTKIPDYIKMVMYTKRDMYV